MSVFVYGAHCTWFGDISQASNTNKHPVYAGANEPSEHGLPCCPHCGGMLFENRDAYARERYFKMARDFEAGIGTRGNRTHPGYVAMLEWQENKNRCFRDLETLARAYYQATGKKVDVDGRSAIT